MNNIREKYNEDNFEIIDSINKMCILRINNILPVELVDNYNGKTSAVYFKDIDFLSVINDIKNGYYADLFLFAKQFSSVKKALVTKDLECMRVI